MCRRRQKQANAKLQGCVFRRPIRRASSGAQCIDRCVPLKTRARARRPPTSGSPTYGGFERAPPRSIHSPASHHRRTCKPSPPQIPFRSRTFGAERCSTCVRRDLVASMELTEGPRYMTTKQLQAAGYFRSHESEKDGWREFNLFHGRGYAHEPPLLPDGKYADAVNYEWPESRCLCGWTKRSIAARRSTANTWQKGLPRAKNARAGTPADRAAQLREDWLPYAWVT